jgi:AraC family transcriptional regulator
MPRLFFFDHDLWETALKLKAQALNPGAGQKQYGEALSIVLMHELLRLNNGASRAKRPIRGGLAGWQEKKVAEYIDEHLSEDVSLATLADVARLSPYHFVRAFKQSFGLPPHRYLSSMRIQQAKSLLANPAMSVTHTGLTPTAYRRGLE